MTIWPEHLAHLLDEGFTPDQIPQLETWGVRSITQEEAERLGFKTKDIYGRYASSSGLLMPYTRSFAQLRCDRPPIRSNGEPAKYLTAIGSTSQAFRPVPDPRVWTEGFKDGGAGTLQGKIPTGALAGVSHYRKALRPGSGAVMLFDADGWLNHQVFSQLVHAGVYLKGKIQLVPKIDGEPKAGLCEYFKAGHTAQDYKKLIDAAMKPEAFLLELPLHWQNLPARKLGACVRSILKLAAMYLPDLEQEQLVSILAEHTRFSFKTLRAELTKQQKLAARKKREAGDRPEPTNEIALQFKKVEKLLGKRLRLNTLTQQIELDGAPFPMRRMRLKLATEYDLGLRREDAEEFVRELAERNAYSPVVQYLEAVYQKYGKEADLQKILEDFALRYFGQSAPIYNTFVVKTLIQAVARALDPGCRAESALILQGGQGCGKTSFFRTLASAEWFDDSLGSASDKDERLKLHRTWFVEWGELESVFKRRDVSQVKNFITSVADNLRPPYGREVERMPRHSVICGTTNLDEFLSDSTGNRRFWVIRCLKSIDIDQLESERDRIWAAAVALYKSGEAWKLSREEEAIAAAIAAEYQTSDPWQEAILPELTHLKETTTRNILDSILKIEPGRQDRGMLMRVADVLRLAGWRKARKGLDRLRVWLAPDQPDPPDPTCFEEVGRTSTPEPEIVSAVTDPPDLPQTQVAHSEKKENYIPPLIPANNGLVLSQTGRSGGSGGSKGSERVENSAFLTRPTLRPTSENAIAGGSNTDLEEGWEVIELEE